MADNNRDIEEVWQLDLDPFQKISLNSDDDCLEYFRPVHSKMVKVDLTGVLSNHIGSTSCMHLKDMVNYNWPQMKSTENLIAFHISGKYIAYGISISDKASIRIHDVTSDKRHRVGELPNSVVDIAFANVPDELLLAAVDTMGNVYIYKFDQNNSFDYRNCLTVSAMENPQTGPYKLAWFQGDKENEVPKFLAITRGKLLEVWNIDSMCETTFYNSAGSIPLSQLKAHIFEINQHSDIITSVKFSFDGTSVATSSLDGKVMFFQIYDIPDNTPQELFCWKPYKGSPVTSMLFLDNTEDDQYWKFIVTFTRNNSFMDIWSCESWTCLQSFNFTSASAGGKNTIHMTPYVDHHSKFIYLSDYFNKILYVLDVFRDKERPIAYVYKFNAFLVMSPILSIHVLPDSCQVVPRRKPTSNGLMSSFYNDEDDDFEFIDLLSGKLDYKENNKVKLYILQPKSLQNCDLVFPSLDVAPDLSKIVLRPVSSADQNGSLNDHNQDPESDLSSSEQKEESLADIKKTLVALLSNVSENQQSQPPQMDLMTPDAFSTTSQTSPHQAKGKTPEVISVSKTSLKMVDVTSLEHDLIKAVSQFEQVETVEPASCGSSPSREVEEIMLQNDEYDSKKSKSMVAEKDTSNWPTKPVVITNNGTTEKPFEVQNKKKVANSSELFDQNHITDLTTTNHLSQEDIVISLQKVTYSVATLSQQVNMITNSMNHITKAIENQGILMAALEQRFERLSIHSSKDKNDRLNQEHLVSQITQAVQNIISEKIQTIIISQFTTLILPSLLETMQPLKVQLQTELTQKLTATDHLLKENLNKIVQSKAILDSITNSVTMSLQATMKECFKEYFRKTIPEYQKACQLMFKQLSETYETGMKQLLNNFETQIASSNKQTTDYSYQISQLNEGVQNVHRNMSTVSVNLNKSFTRLEGTLLDTLNKHLTSQKTALEGVMMSAVQSRAQTPVQSTANQTQAVRNQLKPLLAQRDYNNAFQLALNAQNLTVLMFVCENVDPTQLFEVTPCPLQQHVIISLIQQLSGNLDNHVLLKCQYIDEALSALDVSNPIAREHGPLVLKNSIAKLKSFSAANPTHPAIKNLRKLERVVSGVLKDFE